MSFEVILASCIEALERGESVESCLATYPKHAATLEPLLRIAARIQAEPPPQLSGAAFVHGRGIVAQAAAAHRARMVQSQAEPATERADTLPARPEIAPAGRRAARALPATRQFYWPGLAMLATAACFILIAWLVLRTAALSLPGDGLYPIKRVGEELQGVLMNSYGARAEWHLRQVERRLQEVAALEAAGRSPNAALAIEIDVETEEALSAAKSLPPAEREEMLERWLQTLQSYEQGAAEEGALAAALVTIQAALPEEQRAALVPTFTPTPPAAAPTAALALVPSPTAQDAPATATSTTQAIVVAPTQGQEAAEAPPFPSTSTPQPATAQTGQTPSITDTPPPPTSTPRPATASPTESTAGATPTQPVEDAPPTFMPTTEQAVAAAPPIDGSGALLGPAQVAETAMTTATVPVTTTPGSEILWTPTPTTTVTLTPTETVTPTPIEIATATPTVDGTPVPTATPGEGPPPTATSVATYTETVTPTAMPTVENTPVATSTPTATQEAPIEETATPTPTESPTPADTSTPTATPPPVDTPAPTDTATESPTPELSDTPPAAPLDAPPLDNPLAPQP